MTKEWFAMLERATGPTTTKHEQEKGNFLLAQEYQDFKEFLSNELPDFEDLWNKFQNQTNP